MYISDLHLDDAAGLALLRDWLSIWASRAQSLTILGDLFEAWIGDDDDSPLARDVAALLRQTSDAGCELAFLPGNRDFLIGEAWLNRCGARLLQEPVQLDSFGHRTVLLHGDAECIADTDYQRFRQQVRSDAWRTAFLSQDLAARRQFAAHARAQSQAHTRAASAYLMDADAGELQQRIDDAAAELLIHGHTHRPALHLLHGAHGTAIRAVLGAWHRQPSWLVVDPQAVHLHAEGRVLSAGWGS
ncbi:MAG: UDP-2,3-diacylglucosamine diphosphatase [Xanthomonadales bacterium]|nr:UDP-2,3-diacylglucosamine diphosphatase [Xanthomonadales bacterium]